VTSISSKSPRGVAVNAVEKTSAKAHRGQRVDPGLPADGAAGEGELVDAERVRAGVVEAQVRRVCRVGDVPQVEAGPAGRLVGKPAVLQTYREQVAGERRGGYGEHLHVLGGAVRVPADRGHQARP